MGALGPEIQVSRPDSAPGVPKALYLLQYLRLYFVLMWPILDERGRYRGYWPPIDQSEPMKQPQPHIKRALRDTLAHWPADRPLQLTGPVGVGKRTLRQRLAQTHVEISHRQGGLKPNHKPIRIHPLTVRELGLQQHSQLITLMARGGFPEFIWQTSETNTSDHLPKHLDGLVENVWGSQALNRQRGAPAKAPKDPQALLNNLMTSTGQPLSIHAIASAWGVSDPTMKRWIGQLEDHHALFRLKPLPSPTDGPGFRPPRFRPIKKDQKAYPYDWSLAKNNHARLEALVAGHLLHWVESQVDLFDRPLSLSYFRDCDQREVDFVVCEDGAPLLLVQCEPSIARPCPHLAYLEKKFPNVQAWHLSLEQSRSPQAFGAIHMAHPLDFLMELDLAHSWHTS